MKQSTVSGVFVESKPHRIPKTLPKLASECTLPMILIWRVKLIISLGDKSMFLKHPIIEGNYRWNNAKSSSEMGKLTEDELVGVGPKTQ